MADAGWPAFLVEPDIGLGVDVVGEPQSVRATTGWGQSKRGFAEMDQENELARAKWLLGGVALFLISGCLSYGEIAYFLNGHDAEANVTKVYESRSRRGGTSLTVEYAFSEPDGTQRKGMNSVPTDWPVPPNNKVAVRYTAGEDGSSRLAGRVHWVALTFFAVSIGLVLVFVVRLLREGAEEPKPRRRTR